MPVSYDIDQEAGVVRCDYSGVLDLECVRIYQDELSADPNFDPSYDLLANLQDVDEVNLSSAEMRIISHHSPYDKDTKCAIVTSQDFQFGMLRMYQAIQKKDDDKTMVFRSLTEAHQWLGLDCE